MILKRTRKRYLASSQQKKRSLIADEGTANKRMKVADASAETGDLSQPGCSSMPQPYAGFQIMESVTVDQGRTESDNMEKTTGRDKQFEERKR